MASLEKFFFMDLKGNWKVLLNQYFSFFPFYLSLWRILSSIHVTFLCLIYVIFSLKKSNHKYEL